MKLKKTSFKDVFIISHNIFLDRRGYFKEIFKKKLLDEKVSYKFDFCQENVVKSSLNVLRGMHYQKEPFSQSKLVSVLKGKILDIAIDMRKQSNTYGKYFSIELSEENHESIFIPKGFAHGYLTLSEEAIVHYNVDNYYNSKYEDGISYRDSHLNINWGVDNTKLIISEKDINLKDYQW